jgi:hypothetical protein
MKLAVMLSGSSLFIILTLMVVPGHNFIQAQGSDPYSFSENSSPYGIPYKDWTAKWAAWLDSLPRSQNWNFQNAPGVKYKAEDCSYRQDPSSPVFFLPWVGIERGTTATQTCVVPHNKAVLLPVDAGTSDYSDPTVKIKTPAELIRVVSKSNIYPNQFDATLDGKPLHLKNDEAHKVQSDLFDLTLPKDNVWGEPEGPDKAITQGWWIMLKPLPTGEHTLHYTTGYRDTRSDPSIPPGQGNLAPYIQDVTYRLNVK